MTDDTQFCPNCGVPASYVAPPPEVNQPHYQSSAGDNQHNYQAPAGGQQPNYQNPAGGQQPGYQDPAVGQQPNYQDPAGGQQPPYQDPMMYASPEEKDVQDNKMMAVLAYLGILVLVTIFAAKESKFARYHANQGLVLALAEIAFAIVYSILMAILTTILFSTGAWGLWSIMTTLLGLLWLGFVVLAVIGIVNAVNGRMKPLPLIGKITILK